ncbi:MAG: hypothetical protein V2A61_06325, partial [Calditrichota bacterium]
LIAGRAKNYDICYVWGNQPQNTAQVVGVFPVAILNGGHSEWAHESLWWVGREWYTNRDRYNSLDGAKGCVATTGTWSRPETTQNNCLNGSMLHAFLDMQLSLGWARVFTNFSFWRSFPGNMDDYIAYTEDHSVCGDPGLKYWKGVPRRINVEHPRTIAPGQNYLTARVIDAESDDPVPDIRVTL